MNVLVIAPHPDDEAIGCGGAACLHVSRGDRVVAVFLTSGELGLKELPRREAWVVREAEARGAASILGLARTIFLREPDWYVNDRIDEGAARLVRVLRRERPTLIYVPHGNEWHPDHKAGLPLLRRALESSGIPIPAGRAYEVWTPQQEFDHVENIDAVMARKLRALRSYRSQLKAINYVQAVSGLNGFRGALAGKCGYAEVFQSVSLGDAT